jgi:anti-sigma regulatory factor (Ser/Thr protein kinase)
MRELSLNVMDIVQNSISAKASEIVINISEDSVKDELAISIIDNGKGMNSEQVKSVTDPFYTTRTTRSVGLGVPLFKMEAEQTGGHFEINSEPGRGTNLTAVFIPSSIDMIPLGDINATVMPLIIGNPDINFIYSRSYRSSEDSNNNEFRISTNEIKEALGGDVPLSSPDVVLWLKEFLEENTNELYGIK